MNLMLLLLFIIHFAVALRLYIKRKRLKYMILVWVFLCLIASVVARMFVPDLMVFKVLITTIFRYTAVVLSVIGGSLIVLNMLRDGK